VKILREPLETITAADIHQLCTDKISEGAEMEFKADLPHRGGRAKDSWHTGGAIGEYARNEIAAEIVAFANTFGGAVCVGIDETTDHPKRADTPNPLPRVHELARRLRQAVYDVIEPPLPILEAWGVELNPDGSGVVLLRVAASRRRPHRLQPNKEVFVRRADESVKVSMREIQELTIQAVSEATRIETTTKDRRSQFRAELGKWLHERRTGGRPLWGGGYHLFAVPTTPLDLGRVVGRPKLTDLLVSTIAKFGPNKFECTWPPRRNAWKPGLRSIANEEDRTDIGRYFTHVLRTSGECEIGLRFAATDERPGIFAAWLMGGLGTLLAWIEQIRQEAQTNVEFAVAAQVPIIGKPGALVRYGAGGYDGYSADLPVGEHEFPLMSIGPADEFPNHLQRFDEDIWNLAGREAQQAEVTFQIMKTAKW
jgi:hypothetical protein